MDGNHEDREDALLDAALGSYAGAEPREGLEGRVLARVREKRQVGIWVPRLWLGTGLFSTLLLCVFLAMHFLEQNQPAASHTIARAGNQRVDVAASRQAPPQTGQRLIQTKIRPTHFRQPGKKHAVISRHPLSTPALSEQEKLLLRLAGIQELKQTQDTYVPIVPASIEISSIAIRPLDPLTMSR